jgi:very-short-patch-repair endonuclease
MAVRESIFLFSNNPQKRLNRRFWIKLASFYDNADSIYDFIKLPNREVKLLIRLDQKGILKEGAIICKGVKYFRRKKGKTKNNNGIIIRKSFFLFGNGLTIKVDNKYLNIKIRCLLLMPDSYSVKKNRPLNSSFAGTSPPKKAKRVKRDNSSSKRPILENQSTPENIQNDNASSFLRSTLELVNKLKNIKTGDEDDDDIIKNSNTEEIQPYLATLIEAPTVYEERLNYKTRRESISIKESTTIRKKNQKEELPKTKIETDSNFEGYSYVNYQSNFANNTESYPILRFPKYGCIIRTHRVGRTKRRGFKEESFQEACQLYFSNSCNIFGDIRLNTGKETRPYEPDIAIISLKSDKIIRLDIEVDEPYAGISRQATHCKGEDFVRDSYFIDRGWIVLRFSEFQIHTYQKQCLKFIGTVIQSIDPSYSLPQELTQVADLVNERIWDIVQAQNWERNNYREDYLQHSFQEIEEETETIERDFNEQEINEEKLVVPSLIGTVDIVNKIGFNKLNIHTRDQRIVFYPEPHIYTIDSVPAPSASTIVSKFFPEFDSGYWSMKKSADFGISPEEISLKWKTKGEKAAHDGTFLHKQIESYYLKQEYIRTGEFNLFEQFVSDHRDLKPYRTEWRIFDEQYHFAGTIDLVVKGTPICDNPYQHGIGRLRDIDDTSYNRYCLQQSLYRYIIEKNYGLVISKMYLIVLYSAYESYYKIEAPYLKDKVEYILNTL